MLLKTQYKPKKMSTKVTHFKVTNCNECLEIGSRNLLSNTGRSVPYCQIRKVLFGILSVPFQGQSWNLEILRGKMRMRIENTNGTMLLIHEGD
jgi:hypothetical protein